MSFMTAKALFCNRQVSLAAGGQEALKVFYSESSNEKETDRRACHIAGNPGYGEEVDRDGPAHAR
jgi:hypothetical protein